TVKLKWSTTVLSPYRLVSSRASIMSVGLPRLGLRRGDTAASASKPTGVASPNPGTAGDTCASGWYRGTTRTAVAGGPGDPRHLRPARGAHQLMFLDGVAVRCHLAAR